MGGAACLPMGPGVLRAGSQGPIGGQGAFYVPVLCSLCTCPVHVWVACCPVPCLPRGLIRVTKSSSHPEHSGHLPPWPQSHTFLWGQSDGVLDLHVSPSSSVRWKGGHLHLGSRRGDRGWCVGRCQGADAPQEQAVDRSSRPEIRGDTSSEWAFLGALR